MEIVFIIAGWLACSALAYGATLADMQRGFPELATEDWDKDMSCFLGIMGPFGLIVAALGSRFFKYDFLFRWRRPQ